MLIDEDNRYIAHEIYAEKILSKYTQNGDSAYWGEPDNYYNQNLSWFARQSPTAPWVTSGKARNPPAGTTATWKSKPPANPEQSKGGDRHKSWSPLF